MDNQTILNSLAVIAGVVGSFALLGLVIRISTRLAPFVLIVTVGLWLYAWVQGHK